LDCRTVSVLRCEEFDAKDGEDRTIPLTKDIEAYLRLTGPRGQYTISNGRRAEGKRYRYDFRKWYRLYVDTQAEPLSLPHLTIHDMRRSFASVLVSSRKCSIFEVAQWLGTDTRANRRVLSSLRR
jgi:integrase